MSDRTDRECDKLATKTAALEATASMLGALAKDLIAKAAEVQKRGGQAK